MNSIKLGVIGTGRMGLNHCRVLSVLRDVRLVGVCDLNPDVGRAVAQKYEAAYFSAVEELLDAVDAVCIATPTPSHYDLARQCLQYGVHLFIEKPLTETVAQAESLVALAGGRNCAVQVGHIERFNPAYIELKHVLEDMTSVAVTMRRLSPYAGSNTDVDVVLDLMIHDLDLVLDLIGQEPAWIDAHGLSVFSGAIDHALVNFGFTCGPLISLTASRLTEQKVRCIEVTSLEGYTESDLLNKSISIHRSTIGEYLHNSQRGVKYRQESLIERIHVPIAEPLALELHHFVDCIRAGTPTLVPLEQGTRVLRLATRVKEVIAGQLVNVLPFELLGSSSFQTALRSPPRHQVRLNS